MSGTWRAFLRNAGSHRLLLLLAAILLPGLAACERRESVEEQFARTRLLNETCRRSVGEDFVYRTAAGFELAVPKWASGDLQASEYGPDCSLKDIMLVFAWVDGKLLPVPRGNLYSAPSQPDLPERYDKLVVMMSFKPPRQMVGPEHWEYCKDSRSRVDYPEFKLRMCPQFEKQDPHRPFYGLPYRPRFEVVGEKYLPYSISCADQVFANVTTANATDATTEHTCRGYWYWRPGAAGMFDLGRGKILQKMHLVLPAAERLLDAWVVSDKLGNPR